MAEDNKNVSDEETLNWDETKTTYTSNEVEEMKKQMQSDSEKWVQKLISEKKVRDRAIQSIKKIVDDKEHLVKLYDSDEEVAKIILEDIYDWKSIEDFKESIWYKEDYTDPETIEKLVEKKAKNIVDIGKINDAKAEFIKKLNLEWDELKNFEEAFAERIELKSFKVSNLDTHLEKSYRDISDEDVNQKLKLNKVIGQTLATWEWKSGGTSGKDNTHQKEANDFLKKHKII